MNKNFPKLLLNTYDLKMIIKKKLIKLLWFHNYCSTRTVCVPYLNLTLKQNLSITKVHGFINTKIFFIV